MYLGRNPFILVQANYEFTVPAWRALLKPLPRVEISGDYFLAAKV